MVIVAGRTVRVTWLAQARAWLGTSEGRSLAALLFVASLFRLGFTHLLQIAPDLQQYETWGEAFLQHPLQAYSWVIKGGNVWLFPSYPPLTMYLYAIVDFVYFGTAHLLGLHSSHSAWDPVFRPVLMVPGILTDIAQISIIYALARSRLSQKAALLIAATYAFSPAILIDDAGWGQTDNLALLIGVAALLLAYQRRGMWTGILLGLALLLKPEPWILIPLALLYLYRWAGRRQALRGLAAMTGTALVGWSPFLLPPHPEFFVWRYAAMYTITVSGATATRNGYNLWWILGAQHVNADAPFLGPFSPQIIGGVLFGLTMLLTLLGIWLDSSLGRLWAAAALINIGFSDVGTLGYERYVFPAVGLFLLAALYDRRYWWLYGLVSVSAFICMGSTIFTSGTGIGFQIHGVIRLGRILHSPESLMAASIVNVVCLLAATWIFVNPLSSRIEPKRQVELSAPGTPATNPQFTT